MKRLAITLLVLLAGALLAGSFNLSRSSEAANPAFSVTFSDQRLSRPQTNFAVSNLNDNGPGSLRSAVLAANANPGADAITFSVTGAIILTTGELYITDSLAIMGPGAPLLTVSGNHSSRIFDIAPGITAVISGLAITDGFADGNVVVGGAIVNGGTLTLANSTLSNNSAFVYGGGVFNSGTLTITHSALVGNSALYGAGVYNSGGTVMITNSSLSGNSVNNEGGGILNIGSMTIANSTLSANTASYGGGIFNNSGDLKVTNSTLSGNSATYGGGIYNQATLSVSNGSLSNNSAQFGGGIYNLGTGAIFKNSIVANSTGGDCANSIHASGANFATDSSCLGFTQVTPAELNLGPLELNSPGDTATHALLSGSVAIDAVTDCTDVFGHPVTDDQRGVPRPLDGNGDGVSRCDAGAYEAPTSVAFDLCIQDDGAGYILRINSIAGNYQFTNCSGVTLDGIGSLVKRGGIITLQDYSGGHRVLATIDRGVNRATASIQTQGMIFTITDRNTANDMCTCAAR